MNQVIDIEKLRQLLIILLDVDDIDVIKCVIESLIDEIDMYYTNNEE